MSSIPVSMNGRLEDLVKSPILRVEGGTTLKETTNHKYRVDAPPDPPPDFEEIWPISNTWTRLAWSGCFC
jgi:hypothetical protein